MPRPHECLGVEWLRHLLGSLRSRLEDRELGLPLGHGLTLLFRSYLSVLCYVWVGKADVVNVVVVIIGLLMDSIVQWILVV